MMLRRPGPHAQSCLRVEEVNKDSNNDSSNISNRNTRSNSSNKNTENQISSLGMKVSTRSPPHDRFLLTAIFCLAVLEPEMCNNSRPASRNLVHVSSPQVPLNLESLSNRK